MPIAVYLLLNFLIIACGEDFDETDDLAKLGEIRNEILLIVGEASCSEQPECNYIGLGVKPCGGPWEYLIFSSVNTDTAELFIKVQEYNDWNKVVNKRYEYVSDCSMPEPPKLVCISDKCVDRSTLTGEDP